MLKPKTDRHAFCDESGPNPWVKLPEMHGAEILILRGKPQRPAEARWVNLSP